MLFASYGTGYYGSCELPAEHFAGGSWRRPRDMRVRPTSDRTRQAIFNMLQHKDFGIGFTLEGAAVLDLFAGTGALGIEAHQPWRALVPAGG